MSDENNLIEMDEVVYFKFNPSKLKKLKGTELASQQCLICYEDLVCLDYEDDSSKKKIKIPSED